MQDNREIPKVDEGLRQQDPALVAKSIISENSGLFQDFYGFAKRNVDGIEQMRKGIADSARSIKEAHANGELTQEALIAEIGVVQAEVRMNCPEDIDKFDSNLAFLKAMGAVPDDVTNLPMFINEMPYHTDKDNLYFLQHGVPQRPVKFSDYGPMGNGLTFKYLPTKIDGVYISGTRLYSKDTKGYGQLGFSLMFTGKAVERILQSQPKSVENDH